MAAFGGSWQRSVREGWVTTTIVAAAAVVQLLGLVAPVGAWLAQRTGVPGDRRVLAEPWRPVTGVLAGGSLISFLLMAVLTVWVGFSVERSLGHLRTALVALAGAVGAAAALAWVTGVPMLVAGGIGALGFAWIGAQLVISSAHGLPIRDNAIALVLMLVLSVGMSGAMGLSILGAVAAGIAAGCCIAYLKPRPRRQGNVARLARGGSWTIREWGILGVVALAYVVWALRYLL